MELKRSTTPYDHQVEANNVAWLKPAFAYFLEQGTGKSKIIVDEIINLNAEGLIDCAIIIAPNNVHVNWKEEFIKHGANYQDRFAIQIWTSGRNREKFERETSNIFKSEKTLVFLMNIEALSSPSGQIYLKRILTFRRRAYLAIDESHKIKSPGALRTKAIVDLGRFAKFRRIATGTEAEEGIVGLYSQFKFLDPAIIGTRSYTAFKGLYCIEDQTQKANGQIYKTIVGYKNEEHLASKIAPFIYAKRKHECLTLPDKVYVRHQIQMTSEQSTIYNKLEEQLIYELKSGEIVDATMAMTRMTRLHQVLCGHINTSNAGDRNSSRFNETIASNRADYIAEIVSEASSKVIVFCRFTKDVDLINTSLVKIGVRSVAVSGLLESSRRHDEITRWRTDPGIKALCITTATGGVGLTLNEASTTIFYSNTWSSTDRKQAEDRNHRIGQESKVTYHDVMVPRTIDDKLYYVLMQKRELANEFRSIVNLQRFLTTPPGGYDVE